MVYEQGACTCLQARRHQVVFAVVNLLEQRQANEFIVGVETNTGNVYGHMGIES